MLSLVQFLVLIIALAGLFFGADNARTEIVAQLSMPMDSDSAATVDKLLQTAHRPEQGVTATLDFGAFGSLIDDPDLGVLLDADLSC